MPTFAGNYVREPSDFATVTTEANLIQVADDPADPVVAETVLAWADLQPAESAALAAVINPIIVRKEGIIDGYLRAGGYTVPTDAAANPIILDYAVKLSWNDLRYRKGMLTDQEYADANKETMDQLGLIANGTVAIVTGESVEESPSAVVHDVQSSERIFSRETLEDY